MPTTSTSDKIRSTPDRFYQAPGYRKQTSPASSVGSGSWKITESVPDQKIENANSSTDAKQGEISGGASTSEDKLASQPQGKVTMSWKKKVVPFKMPLTNLMSITMQPPLIEAQNSSHSNLSNNGVEQLRNSPVSKSSELPTVGRMRQKKARRAPKKKPTGKTDMEATSSFNQLQTENPVEKILRKANKTHMSFKQKTPVWCARNESLQLSQEEDESKDNLADIPVPIKLLGDWETMFDSNTLEDPAAQKQRAYASKFLEDSAGFKCTKKPTPGKLILDPRVMRDYAYVYNYNQLQSTNSNEQTTIGGTSKKTIFHIFKIDDDHHFFI